MRCDGELPCNEYCTAIKVDYYCDICGVISIRYDEDDNIPQHIKCPKCSCYIPLIENAEESKKRMHDIEEKLAFLEKRINTLEKKLQPIIISSGVYR